MRTLVRWMLVAAVVAVAGGSALAQRQPGGQGGQRGGQGGQPGGGFGGGFGMGGGGAGGLKALLATNKALQEEVKLSAEQIDKITKFQEKQAAATRPAGGGGRGAGGGGGGGGRGAGGGGGGPGGGFGGGFGGGLGAFGGAAVAQSDEDRLEALKTQVKSLEDRIAFFKETLTADQTKRISQIELQQSMQTAGPGVFSSPKVAKALSITDDQKEKLKGVTDEYAKESGDLMREYFGGGGGGGGGGASPEQRAEMQKKQKGLRDEATEKVEKMLTADQKKAWKDLVGEPFDLAKLAPQRRDN